MPPVNSVARYFLTAFQSLPCLVSSVKPCVADVLSCPSLGVGTCRLSSHVELSGRVRESAPMRKWTARQMLVMPKLLNKSSHLTQVTRDGVTHPPSPLPLDFQQTLSS